MRRMLLTASLLLPLIAGGVAADAAGCRDAKGKFVKCPAAAPAKPVRCKDAKGRFVKCGTPGAKPM